jgi:tetratricopeptide (TPR) repeat protein
MRFLNFDEIIVLKEYCNLQVASAGNIHYKFYDFVHEHLIVNEDKKYVDSAYAYLIENISVKRNANIIEEYYNYGLAEYYDGARNRKLALKFLLKTIEVNPENNFAMSMAAKTISKVVYEFDVDDYYDSMTDEEYDSLEDELSEGELRLGILENYLDEYPVLGETSVIKSLYYYLLTETSTEAFDDFNDEAMGLEFMEKALNQKKKIEDPDLINDDITAWMYAAAGAYYYRDNQLQKALEYILEGLKISPDHPRLLNKEKIIRNKLN